MSRVAPSAAATSQQPQQQRPPGLSRTTSWKSRDDLKSSARSNAFEEFEAARRLSLLDQEQEKKEKKKKKKKKKKEEEGERDECGGRENDRKGKGAGRKRRGQP